MTDVNFNGGRAIDEPVDTDQRGNRCFLLSENGNAHGERQCR